MAPLSNEVRPITSCLPFHIGPAIPEVSILFLHLFPFFIHLSVNNRLLQFGLNYIFMQKLIVDQLLFF